MRRTRWLQGSSQGCHGSGSSFPFPLRPPLCSDFIEKQICWQGVYVHMTHTTLLAFWASKDRVPKRRCRNGQEGRTRIVEYERDAGPGHIRLLGQNVAIGGGRYSMMVAPNARKRKSNMILVPQHHAGTTVTGGNGGASGEWGMMGWST